MGEFREENHMPRRNNGNGYPEVLDAEEPGGTEQEVSYEDVFRAFRGEMEARVRTVTDNYGAWLDGRHGDMDIEPGVARDAIESLERCYRHAAFVEQADSGISHRKEEVDRGSIPTGHEPERYAREVVERLSREETVRGLLSVELPVLRAGDLGPARELGLVGENSEGDLERTSVGDHVYEQFISPFV
ncbi:MAG: hypothetical protein ABEJ64_00020 [Candidatus Nanohaloarchaea archaeon]